MSKTTLKKHELAEELSSKDLKMLRECISYDKDAGVFYRVKTGKQVTINCQRPQSVIHVQRGEQIKQFTAWRSAVFFAKGFYPSFKDNVIFNDGNNKNFKINNITICHISDDEQSVADFALENNLSNSYVNNRMKGCSRVRKSGRTGWVYFYKKSDFIKNCNDLINNDFVIIKRINLSESQRGNKTAREFLKTWIGDMPTQWEMTLCR
jgi:hypothetical protein